LITGFYEIFDCKGLFAETCPSSARGFDDMIESLKWVQKYIHYFQGDNKSVTVGGLDGSACGVSLITLGALSMKAPNEDRK
jgi:carboxylesterase type B